MKDNGGGKRFGRPGGETGYKKLESVVIRGKKKKKISPYFLGRL